MSAAVCSECGEPAVQAAPSTWVPAWGPKPSWSHSDGEPLCGVQGTNDHLGESAYIPCGPEFVG